MKALTLTQPWATLVTLEEKIIETHSWGTSYRGPLAIHAAVGFPGWAKRQCFLEPFAGVLIKHGFSPDNLPLGRILCLTSLEDCIKTEGLLVTFREWAFDDFSPGRFAWFLGPIVKRFDPGIFARGKRGLWDWSQVSEA